MLLEEIIQDEKLMCHFINRVVPFPKMLDLAGLKGGYSHNCLCPFHENTETPAARIYNNPDGDKLFCYAEHKMYNPSDVVTKGLINIRLENFFMKIYKQLTPSDIDIILESYQSQKSYIPVKWTENKAELDKFRQGKVSLQEHLETVINSTY